MKRLTKNLIGILMGVCTLSACSQNEDIIGETSPNEATTPGSNTKHIVINVDLPGARATRLGGQSRAVDLPDSVKDKLFYDRLIHKGSKLLVIHESKTDNRLKPYYDLMSELVCTGIESGKASFEGDIHFIIKNDSIKAFGSYYKLGTPKDSLYFILTDKVDSLKKYTFPWSLGESFLNRQDDKFKPSVLYTAPYPLRLRNQSFNYYYDAGKYNYLVLSGTAPIKGDSTSYSVQLNSLTSTGLVHIDTSNIKDFQVTPNPSKTDLEKPVLVEGDIKIEEYNDLYWAGDRRDFSYLNVGEQKIETHLNTDMINDESLTDFSTEYGLTSVANLTSENIKSSFYFTCPLLAGSYTQDYDSSSVRGIRIKTYCAVQWKDDNYVYLKTYGRTKLIPSFTLVYGTSKNASPNTYSTNDHPYFGTVSFDAITTKIEYDNTVVTFRCPINDYDWNSNSTNVWDKIPFHYEYWTGNEWKEPEFSGE